MGRDEAAQVAYDGVPSSQETRTYSMKSTGSARSNSIRRKPVGAGAPAAAAHPLIPTTPVPPIPPPKEQSYMQQLEDKRTSGQSNFSFERNSDSSSLHAGGDEYHDEQRDSISHTIPEPKSIAYGQRNVENGLKNLRISQAAEIGTVPQLSEPRNSQDGYHARPRDDSPRSSAGDSPQEQVPQLQYFHQMGNEPPPKARPGPRHRMQSPSQDSHSSSERGPGHYASRSDLQLHVPPSSTTPRPSSAYLPGADFRGRAHSPHLSVGGSPGGSPILQGRGASTNRRSPETRPISYVDLLNIPYSQQVAPSANLGANALLKNSVGQNAALLDTKKTLDMYRANVKKTQDSAVQYEFAVFMVQVARDLMSRPPGTDDSGMDPNELLREARSIFQKLADRSYPFAQYYLADGYASGVFNKGKEDYDRAFPLFVAASKHGHAEAGYRAALCYEFGWGCRKDYAKAVQFYRASASRNHPGAATRLGKACLTGDMGLTDKYREGLKWLKRAAESADPQYNAGPYELGLLHETGFGPDLFKDEAYAAQLFTQAADLGHPQASLRMGEAYEHGLLSCPRDPALSVHFYNGAAQAGIPEAMMNLCAWYMVGAEPVLEKDESEAYEWAKRAAEMGLPKAEYAIGYFTEMGIGCRRDPLEANVWYVRAADKGDERAKQRLAIIRAAASGEGSAAVASPSDKKNKKKDDKDCVIM